MKTLEAVQHPCKVIVMDPGLDACQILTTMNKEHYTKFGFLYQTEMYPSFKLKFFPGKLYARNGVLYLGIDPLDSIKHVPFHNHVGEDQLSHDYLKSLDHMYKKYLNGVFS